MPSAKDHLLSIMLANANITPAAPVITSVANVQSAPLMAPVRRAKGQPSAPTNAAPVKRETNAPHPLREEENEGSGIAPTLLVPGTYDARRFMAAWRNAGLRETTVDGRTAPHYYQNLARQDRILAMSGFKGYDPKGDYSRQETMALFYAKREIQGIEAGPTREQIRSAQRTAHGYVAGMPNNAAKQAQHNAGRMRGLTDDLIAVEKVIAGLVEEGMAKDLADGHKAEILARLDVERTRRHEILKDLSGVRKALEDMGIDLASEAPEHAPQMGIRHPEG